MIITNIERKNHPVFSKIADSLWDSLFKNNFDTDKLRIVGVTFDQVTHELLPSNLTQACILLSIIFPEQNLEKIYEKVREFDPLINFIPTLCNTAEVGKPELIQELDPRFLNELLYETRDNDEGFYKLFEAICLSKNEAYIEWFKAKHWKPKMSRASQNNSLPFSLLATTINLGYLDLFLELYNSISTKTIDEHPALLIRIIHRFPDAFNKHFDTASIIDLCRIEDETTGMPRSLGHLILLCHLETIDDFMEAGDLDSTRIIDGFFFALSCALAEQTKSSKQLLKTPARLETTFTYPENYTLDGDSGLLTTLLFFLKMGKGNYPTLLNVLIQPLLHAVRLSALTPSIRSQIVCILHEFTKCIDDSDSHLIEEHFVNKSYYDTYKLWFNKINTFQTCLFFAKGPDKKIVLPRNAVEEIFNIYQELKMEGLYY